MIKLKSSKFALVGLLTFAGLTYDAQAMPMFTTQTGMDCTGCHTQHMPRLNKFGRKFAASGMTMSKTNGRDGLKSIIIDQIQVCKNMGQARW